MLSCSNGEPALPSFCWAWTSWADMPTYDDYSLIHAETAEKGLAGAERRVKFCG